MRNVILTPVCRKEWQTFL